MNINEIIVYVMTGFMVVGAIDKCLNNRFGLGQHFDEGFMAMGPLAIAVVGVVSLAPALASVLEPLVVPIYTMLGADPAMFAATLLANDMGGYPLAMELAQSQEAGLFAGLIVSTMMGATVVFNIPVALSIIKKEDHPYLALGVMLGLICVPVGCLAAGLVAGFEPAMVLKNLTPIVLVSLLLILGLWKIPEKMMYGFEKFGRGVSILITVGTAAAVFEALTGIVVIPGMAPVWDGLKLVGAIGIVLLGAFPMVQVMMKVLKGPLLRIGGLLKINDTATGGLLMTLANAIPMFDLVKDMGPKGKVMNFAFVVTAGYALGDHLGFTAGVDRQMIFPMVTGHLVAGITALVVAKIVLRHETLLTPRKPMVQESVKSPAVL